MMREFCDTIDFTPDADLPLDDLMLKVFDRFWKGNSAIKDAERIVAVKGQQIDELGFPAHPQRLRRAVPHRLYQCPQLHRQRGNSRSSFKIRFPPKPTR